MSDENSQAPKLLSMPILFARFALICLIMSLIAASFLYAGGWLSPHKLTPKDFVNQLEANNGPQPGFRRNHAKGICVTGSFASNGTGERLSKASLFKPVTTPVVGRFALAGGQVAIADAPTSVRSMALQFKLANGQEWRTGMNDIPVFVVNTPQAFLDQLRAAQPDPDTGKPDPTKMQTFLAAHPETARALTQIKSQPFSTGFDNASYNSLDTFRFINATGQSLPVRWSMVAVNPFVAESGDQGGTTDKNYLFDALAQTIAKAPPQWHLIVTLGHPEDKTNDATIAWPEDREKVDVGTLTLDRAETESANNCRDINFDPLVLPDGIAGSDDPLLSARSATYAKSVTRRDGEAKEPSPVSLSLPKQTEATQ